MRETRTYVRKPWAVVALTVCAALAAGCGGGGGGGRTSDRATTGVSTTSRGTLRTTNLTYYLPNTQSWLLYKATAGYTWTSAIGTSAGSRASISVPCEEFGVVFMPKGTTYNNGATVNFYVDGVSKGSLSFTGDKPYSTYKDGQTSYYSVATGLNPNVYHTLTMEIATGTVAFDGWKFIVDDSVYIVDASDVNTLESGAMTEFNKVRDAIEAYMGNYGTYPDPASSTTVIDFLYATGPYFTSYPQNTFTRNNMAATATYSAGDYLYTRGSDTSYTLVGYGGRGDLVTYTPTSVETDLLTITLTAPTNHMTTASGSVTFTGTVTAGNTLTICCGLSGEYEFPSSGSFSQEVTLKEGLNTIKIELTDLYGNKITLARSVTKDTTAPEIRLLDPFPLHGPGTEMWVDVYTATTTVRVYVEPRSTATINGVSVDVDSLGVASRVIDLVPGDNYAIINATDIWNNSATKQFKIKYNQ